MLSDRIGSRKRPILFGRGVLVLLLFPAFMLMNRFPQLSVVMSLTARFRGACGPPAFRSRMR